MKELIAKRYIKALKETTDEASFENIAALFDVLSSAFEDPKFAGIINNPEVPASEKQAILLDAVKGADSTQVNNLISLLVEKGRVSVIPSIATEMNKEISRIKKSFSGVVYSDSDIDAKTLEGLSTGLGKKVDASVALEFVKTDFDGIKVEVEDLGIEINFSKTRLNMQLVEHILKAI